MVFGWIRLYLVGAVVLTVVYALLSVYARSVRREQLEAAWDNDASEMTRDAYVEAGMAEYRRSLWPKLFLIVYVVPAVAVPAITYLLNFN